MNIVPILFLFKVKFHRKHKLARTDVNTVYRGLQIRWAIGNCFVHFLIGNI